jgi:hypothetical protein
MGRAGLSDDLDAYLGDFRYDLPRDAIRITVDARSANTAMVWFWPEQAAIREQITDRILKEGRVRGAAFTTLPRRGRKTQTVTIGALPATRTLARVCFEYHNTIADFLGWVQENHVQLVGEIPPFIAELMAKPEEKPAKPPAAPLPAARRSRSALLPKMPAPAHTKRRA